MPDKEDVLPLLPNASSILEIVGGWPQCAIPENYATIGNATDAKLAPDGSLTLNGTHFPMGQYCIVKTVEEVDQPAKVFGCREHVILRYFFELVCFFYAKRRNKTNIKKRFKRLLVFQRRTQRFFVSFKLHSLRARFVCIAVCWTKKFNPRI